MTIVGDDLRQDYGEVAVERVARFLTTRTSEAKSWSERYPNGLNPVELLRLTIEPNCDFFCDCFMAGESPCLRGVWLRCMEAAGLPGRPYTGERAHLAQTEQERAAKAAAALTAARRVALVARFLDAYPSVESWQSAWTRVPVEESDEFFAALREGAAEAWLDARHASPEGLQSNLIVRAKPRKKNLAAGAVQGSSSSSSEDKKREPRRPAQPHQASGRKRRSKAGERLHPFPYPRYSAKRTGNGAFMRSVWRWGRVEALRALNAAQDTGEPIPDDRALVAWLVELIESRGAKYIVSSYDRQSSTRYPNEILDLDVEPTAVAVIKSVLDQWDPTFLEQARRRGAAGGRNSRRGATFTIEMLDDLRGATAQDQAAALGCSVRQIFKLREQRRSLGYAN